MLEGQRYTLNALPCFVYMIMLMMKSTYLGLLFIDACLPTLNIHCDVYILQKSLIGLYVKPLGKQRYHIKYVSNGHPEKFTTMKMLQLTATLLMREKHSMADALTNVSSVGYSCMFICHALS